MEEPSYETKPKFIVDGKGKKQGVLLSLTDYRKMESIIEDLEDTIDLLRAEKESESFTAYDKFRKKWLPK